jgi:hypothetical protein
MALFITKCKEGQRDSRLRRLARRLKSTNYDRKVDFATWKYVLSLSPSGFIHEEGIMLNLKTNVNVSWTHVCGPSFLS